MPRGGVTHSRLAVGVCHGSNIQIIQWGAEPKSFKD